MLRVALITYILKTITYNVLFSPQSRKKHAKNHFFIAFR
jgi:hypothetical protein